MSTYRSPRTGSAAAATTPARLAREFGEVLWRERPDGGIEVATIRKGQVDRYAVNDDGSTTLLGSSPSPFSRPLAPPACLVGVVLFVAGAASDTAWLALPGFALVAVAFVVWARADNLAARLGKKSEWHTPTALGEWTPRSSAQLETVEWIAEEHDGKAYVRDVGSRTVDVAAMRGGRFERYWVDELGRSELADSKPASARYLLDRALQTAAFALWLGILTVAFAVDENKIVLLIALIGLLGTVMFFGWRNERRYALEHLVKRLADDGYPWIEIRTRVEESDGG
jgi:hypothetical protein